MSKTFSSVKYNVLNLILISICPIVLLSCGRDKGSTKAPAPAILIVEFAKRRRDEGEEVIRAAIDAARTRLRPILMTAFAFILGVVPFVIASGAGVNSTHSLGTDVFGGMIVSTFLSLLIVPVLYVLIEKLRERCVNERKP